MIGFVLGLTLLAISPEEIAREAQGRVGASAQVLETGKVVLALDAKSRYPMQSVYKLPIAMAALAEVDRGKLNLDGTMHVDPSEYISKDQHSPLRDDHPKGADVPLRELIRLAVQESDGTASDVVMRMTGGPAAVMRYLRSIGVRDVTVRDTEMAMGHDWSLQYKNWATPDGAITLLRALDRSHRELLMKWLIESRITTRLKGLLPADAVVAHKTGSSGERDGIAAATNDIGILTLPGGKHLAIAVFVSDSKASPEVRDQVIAKIAREAWDRAVNGRF